jgi:hypothetical protein
MAVIVIVCVGLGLAVLLLVVCNNNTGSTNGDATKRIKVGEAIINSGFDADQWHALQANTPALNRTPKRDYIVVSPPPTSALGMSPLPAPPSPFTFPSQPSPYMTPPSPVVIAGLGEPHFAQADAVTNAQKYGWDTDAYHRRQSEMQLQLEHEVNSRLLLHSPPPFERRPTKSDNLAAALEMMNSLQPAGTPAVANFQMTRLPRRDAQKESASPIQRLHFQSEEPNTTVNHSNSNSNIRHLIRSESPTTMLLHGEQARWSSPNNNGGAWTPGKHGRSKLQRPMSDITEEEEAYRRSISPTKSSPNKVHISDHIPIYMGWADASPEKLHTVGTSPVTTPIRAFSRRTNHNLVMSSPC